LIILTIAYQASIATKTCIYPVLFLRLTFQKFKWKIDTVNIFY